MITTTKWHKINITYMHSQCTACEEKEGRRLRRRWRWRWLLACCAVSCRLSSSRRRSIRHGFLQAAAPAGFDRRFETRSIIGFRRKERSADAETASSDLRNLIFNQKHSDLIASRKQSQIPESRALDSSSHTSFPVSSP